jgi:hypothetical protein
VGYINIKNWRKRTKSRMIAAMGGECVCCGYDRCLSALEFHHIDRTQKSFSFGNWHVCRWAEIIEELKKCVLVCANCHREVEEGAKELPKILPIFDESYTVLEKHQKSIKKHSPRNCFCGSLFEPNSPSQKFCSVVCSKKFHRKVQNRPSIETLKTLLETNSFEALGRRYGVSGNAVRKWLK